MEEQPSALRVENVVRPVRYRVYPETPLSEVIDLMVRRGLHAVPVVGEGYEVLGIITTGDALRQVLRESPGDDTDEPADDALTARDVMTRAVLCVSESQPLLDAARMMLNRKVEQLPVVRDGELVGLITRDTILHAIHADTHADDNDKTDDDS